MSKRLILLICLILPAAAFSDDPPLRPDLRTVPGTTPTPWLRFQDPAATSVVVAGSWDGWSGRFPMQLADGVWTLDTRTLPASFGQHDFKFILNGEWEKGENRSLYVNGERLLDKPSDLIFNAAIDDRSEINVTLRRGVPENAKLDVRLVPDTPIQEFHLAAGREAGSAQGYFLAGGLITFVFDENNYGLNLGPNDRVTVAGNFNGWDSSGGGGRWILNRPAGGGLPEADDPARRAAAAAGREGPAVQVRRERQPLAAAAARRAERGVGRQGQHESQDRSGPGRRHEPEDRDGQPDQPVAVVCCCH